MIEIFLFGTLCHGPVLRAVVGEDLSWQLGEMAGVRVCAAQGTGWPVLVEDAAATAQGRVISVSPDMAARIDDYEACFGYRRARGTVTLGGVSRVVWVYRAEQGAAQVQGPWSLSDWARDWGALEVLSAQEVMRQLQSAPPSEVGARFWMIAARAQSVLAAQSWHRPGLVGANPPRSDVALQDHEFPYSKFFAVEEFALTHRRFDGSDSPTQERAVFRVADAVTVLPYDPLRDRILLVEQLRLGAYAHGDGRPWLLEPIAGMIDAGETPEAAAHRETGEEAGLSLGALHLCGRYYPSPGGLAQVLISYVGIADLPDEVTGIGGHDAEGEDILSHLVPWELACDMLAAGDMVNAPLLISMQWLQLNRARLRGSG